MTYGKGFLLKRIHSFLIILFILLVFTGGNIAAESELEFGGFADTLFAWRLGLDDSTGAQLLAAKTRLHPEIDIYAGDAYFTASADLEYNSLVESRVNFALREVYAEYAGSFFDFRLGRQIISWGRADGLEITDIICPKDKTEIIGREYDDSRLPVDGLSFRFFGTFYTIEAVLIPFFTPSALPTDDENPLSEIFFPNTISFRGMMIPVTYGEAKRSYDLKDGEAAVRASFFLPVADFSFYFFRGWEDEPFWNMSVTFPPPNFEVRLDPEYGRIWMAGLDAAFPFADFVLRLESAWFSGRRYMCDAPDAEWIGKDQIKAMAGLDWTPGAGWMITAQYLEDWLIDYDDALKRDEREPLATLSLSKTLLRETLKLSAAAMMGFNYFDSVINISADYALTDEFHLSAGSDIFLPGPDNDGYFGMLKKFSSVNIKGRFNF